MTINDISQLFIQENIQIKLHKMYGDDIEDIKKQIKRYQNLVRSFILSFDEEPDYLFSAPGRVEIAGNHTDHNGGCVIASSVDIDAIAAVKMNNDNCIRLFSEGYSKETILIDLRDLSIQKCEINQTPALIRGIVARFKQLGLKYGGFNSYLSSNVSIGSGLSSSAAFEVLISTILNTLYNSNTISEMKIAQIGQFSENHFYGKPCGLMDQIASAVGGIVHIDFKDKTVPRIEKVSIDFNTKGYALLIVDTKGDHCDLTQDYAGIPIEMQTVCDELEIKQCRDIESNVFFDKLSELRPIVGDRAILRCIHFFDENERVAKIKSVLEDNQFGDFLNLIDESGQSSFSWLQNCHSPRYPKQQGISLCLLMTKKYFKQSNIHGACRVHGGGFAGSILVFLPNQMVKDYSQFIENIFGSNSVDLLKIRSIGANCVYS